ncbi:MAG TPA: peptidase S10 [Candidatus Dormibacteraeota bacterium]
MADEATEKKDEKKGEDAKPPEPPPERESTTRGKVTIRGAEVAYKAVAGTYHLKDDDGKVKASLFYVAYTREGVRDLGTRPITFAFNGGPGSAAVWLHLGVLGPRRIDVGGALETVPPPYQLVDNEFSPLDFTDLVFIDPVSTGFSRPAPGQDPKDFHGVKEDAESVSDFIRLWLTRERRWPSPKYLIGESYGTTRSAALSAVLQERHGIYLNGIVLVSCVLYLQTIQLGPENDLPYPLYLPSYAVTALYHERLSGELESVVEEVEDFALREYSSLLMRVGRVTEAERTRALRRVAAYSGLSRDFVDRCDLRIDPLRFQKELLRSDRRTLGRFDSRVTGHDSDAAGERPEYDPSFNFVQGPFTAAVNHYLRAELEFAEDLPYRVIADVSPWKMVDPQEGGYLEVGSKLRAAMSRNPGLRVLLMSGYYDLATPFLGAEWTLDHIRVEPRLRANIVKRRYPAGHMMYVHDPSLEAMRADLEAFVTEQP